MAKSDSFQRDAFPVGLQQAILYSIVDLGSQEIEWKGEKKLQRKVLLTFEFPDIKREYDGVEKPRVKGVKFTLSMSEQGNLRKKLTSWLSKDPGDEFDIETLLGKNATISIIEKKSKDGKVFEAIDAILPSKEKIKAFNELVCFNLDDFKQSIFDSLPEWQRNEIAKSPEYQAIEIKPQVKKEEKQEEDMPF